MNYDPLDPKNYAFYATFIDDEPYERPPLPGCSGCLMVIAIAVGLMMIAAVLR